MMRQACASLVLLTFGCGEGQVADQGTTAQLTLKGGVFVRESLPHGELGPSVEAAYLGQTTFSVGFQNKSFSGVLGVSATAVAIALEGDEGYWIVPAGPALAETPDLPSFDAPLSFAATVPAGQHELRLAAVDANERFGPRKSVPFTLSARPLPEGRLVFSLSWDRPSDLDLRVALPDGSEVSKDNVNSWRATGEDGDAEAFRNGGQLDFDSNADCRLDGRNRENVVWSVEPPHGRYRVRVDTFSLCGEETARWSVEARYRGEQVALATGVSLPTDTRPPTSSPVGVTAFELWVH